MKLMDAFQTVAGSTLVRTELEAIAARQIYLKPWTGPWEKREFPDNVRYGQHVRKFSEMSGATDGEGTQLWGVSEDRMVVTTPAGYLHPRRRLAWELLLPDQVPVAVPNFLADLDQADVKPDLAGKPIYWSWWNGLLGGENYLLLTCEGLPGGADKAAVALVQVGDLLEAIEQRTRSEKSYKEFLEKVHADLAGITR